MVSEHENDILFDDVSILESLHGGNTVVLASPVNDCDCIDYKSTLNTDEFDTDKITASVGQAN